MPEIDDTDGLEAVAVEALGGEPSEGANPPGDPDTPRCPTCGRATDDVEGMDEGVLLANLRTEILREYLRRQRAGTLTHQEQNIAKTLILANLPRIKAPVEPEPRDEHLPEPNTSRLPERRFDYDTYRDTEG